MVLDWIQLRTIAAQFEGWHFQILSARLFGWTSNLILVGERTTSLVRGAFEFGPLRRIDAKGKTTLFEVLSGFTKPDT